MVQKILGLHHRRAVRGPTTVWQSYNGTCTWDASALTLMYRMNCDYTQTFSFPDGRSLAPAGGLLRAVDNFSGSQAQEVNVGANICDINAAAGWVALCDGRCDLTTCGNVLDYVVKEGASPAVTPPPCAGFTPAPIDVTGATAGQSLSRTAFAGRGASGLASDWTLAPVSRD